ncbi:18932_t:CDS:1, partial [Racocetra persica]
NQQHNTIPVSSNKKSKALKWQSSSKLSTSKNEVLAKEQSK